MADLTEERKAFLLDTVTSEGVEGAADGWSVEITDDNRLVIEYETDEADEADRTKMRGVWMLSYLAGYELPKGEAESTQDPSDVAPDPEHNP